MKKTLGLALFLVTMIFGAPKAHAFTFSSTDPLQQGWAARPLSFFVNRENCPSNIDARIQSAFDLWNSVTSSSLKLVIGADSTQTGQDILEDTATDVPLIACDPDFSATVGVDGSTIPGVGTLGGSSFRPIRAGGLILNVEADSESNINGLSETIVDVVVAHEIGHVLGLGHSSDIDSLMYYSAGAKGHLALSQDDIDGITFLYPRNELKNPKMIGGCGTLRGVSNDDPWWGGNSLGLLALAYALWRFGVLLRSSTRVVPQRR